MPRRSRLAIAGIPWHIIQRGNNRTACFYSDEDYSYYLATLKDQAKKFGCEIHAYVLMKRNRGQTTVFVFLEENKGQTTVFFFRAKRIKKPQQLILSAEK